MSTTRRASLAVKRRKRTYLLGFYAVLILASNLVRWNLPEAPLPPNRSSMTLPAFRSNGETRDRKDQRLAWLTWEDGQMILPEGDFRPHREPEAVAQGTEPQRSKNTLQDHITPNNHSSEDEAALRPLILLHGSPGTAGSFQALAPPLSEGRLILAPDLPGFGASSHRVPSYSIAAHAHSILAWMDELNIEQAHIFGHSMGGGVALEMWNLAPERVASVTMVASIGVQELELLGDYHLNHLLHGLQLVGLESLRILTPHFGLIDGILDHSYERNFYDTDQRPLRKILRRFEPPMLIVHGVEDPLVPVEAAVEHARIVAQSTLVKRDDSHFFVFRKGSGLDQTVRAFLTTVDNGTAPSRSQATASRTSNAEPQFDREALPNWSGPALVVVLLLIAAATLVSEDLTLIGTGLLVAQGRLDYLPAATAAFVGIVAGDMLLFWAGRALGRRVVRRPPLSWWITPQALRESSKWLRRRGAMVVLITRVLPGARLPTNVAAGLLRTSALRFLSYFTLAGIIWTFPVVWLCIRLGERILPELNQWRWRLLAGLLVLGGTMWLVRKLLVPLATWRGRRRLVGAWRHRIRWEFWPTLFIYLPVVPTLLWQSLKHRGLTVFTAANPGIPAGGFVGESKAQILGALPQDVVPAWIEVPAQTSDNTHSQRLATLQTFFEQHDLSWPMVVKPDVGERGSGVLIARSWDEVKVLLGRHPKSLIGQQFVKGNEYSVFWIKRPSEPAGKIYSITVKRQPTVVGDGARSLHDLTLADERAVALAAVYLEENPDAKESVPADGETVLLSEVGAHSRGTIFEEGEHLITEELTAAVAKIAANFAQSPNLTHLPSHPSDAANTGPDSNADTGFDYGRFDLITESDATLKAGKDLHILELNGVTSESTNMYDAHYGIFNAWQTLRDQWRHCYAIGAERRTMGYKPVGVLSLLRDWYQARS